MKKYILAGALVSCILISNLPISQAAVKNEPELVIGESEQTSELKQEGTTGILVQKDGTILSTDTVHHLLWKQSKKKNEILVGINEELDTPYDILPYQEGYIVSDCEHHVLRYIVNGKVTTFAGSGEAGNEDGKATEARFESPTGLAMDPDGNLYVSDTYNNVIRKVTADGTVTTFAGGEDGYQDGTIKEAKFHEPMGLYYANGGLYVVDSGNQRIRLVKDGVVTTIAGDANQQVDEVSGGYVGNMRGGSTKYAEFSNPTDIVVTKDGTVYLTDTGNSRIRCIKNQTVSSYYISQEENNTLNSPSGLCLQDNFLYVSDEFTGNVYRFNISERVER